MSGKGKVVVLTVLVVGFVTASVFISQSRNVKAQLVETVKVMRKQQREWFQAADNRQADVAASEELAAVRRQGISQNLAGVDISKMDSDEIIHTMHSILDNSDTQCSRKLRMGKIGDGGWEICDDVDVRPRHPCIVYSFGINNDFSFDDKTAKYYGCHVYSFDPSMKQESHNRSDKVHFYKIGIAGETTVNKRGWKLYTFSDIRKLLGHVNATIDVVKIDVEGAEWSSLKHMVASGEIKHFKQLLLEYHVATIKRDSLEVVQSVESQGYKKFYTHKNPACPVLIPKFPSVRTNCYEVHYLRRP